MGGGAHGSYAMAIRTGRWAAIFIATLSVFSVTASAEAGVPAVVTHQGRLYDAKDTPISETLAVVFTIYDAPDAAGKPLWTETQMVTFDNGYFSAELGAMTPFDKTVFDG